MSSKDTAAAPAGTFASSPCAMPELEPPQSAALPRGEILALLNELLEGERAGVSGLLEINGTVDDVTVYRALRGIAGDEADCCAMLIAHIKRLGGVPGGTVGGFYDKLVAAPSLADRLRLLERGQSWVVRRLRDVLPRIGDPRLAADLEAMLRLHERNVEACRALTP